MKLKEHQELLGQIRTAEKAALKLLNSGQKISRAFQSLRTAGDEIESRVKLLERDAQPPTPEKPDPREALFQKSKNELLTLVDEFNTTPGRTSLITLEPNANKAQIVEAILAATTEAQT